MNAPLHRLGQRRKTAFNLREQLISRCEIEQREGIVKIEMTAGIDLQYD